MTDKSPIPSLAALAGLLLALTLGVARAADAPAAKPAPADPNKPLVTVNGTVLTVKDLQVFARSVSAARGQQLPRDEVLNSFIDRELLFQEAMSKGYDKQPDVIQELANEKRSLLAGVTVNQLLSAKPITDQELHKFFEERVLSQKINEYKARHILVKTEGEAKDIIAQLDKGAEFSALAKSKSLDTGSAEKGGDLGWFAPAQMVPEFSQATAGLDKGKYTKAPVKSQFGWHVIVLDDVRPVTSPKFEDVKDRLQGLVQNQRLNEHLAELRKAAKIEAK